MNLIRLLVIVTIIWLVYRMYQNWVTSNIIAKKKQKEKPEITNMVQCTTCGVHLPEHEALKQGQQFYCCEAHKK